MNKYKGYLIDLDGTIYQGSKKIPAAKRFIERLQKDKIPFLFVTNNTTKQPIDVVENLAVNHDINVSVNNVYTAGQATAEFLSADAEKHKRNQTAYVIGENGLKALLTKADFDLYSDNPDYVVVALDYDVTYHKLATAVLEVQKGAHFIGTNADSLIPSEKGMLPSAGSIVDLVRYATKVDPVIVGKPNNLIIENAIKKINLPAKDVVMVGDNYDTDILAGINAKIDTLLVYSGVSKPDVIKDKKIKPTNEIKS